jgi:hypothetical protein
MKRETIRLLNEIAEGGKPVIPEAQLLDLLHFVCEALAAAHTHDPRTAAVVPLLKEED